MHVHCSAAVPHSLFVCELQPGLCAEARVHIGQQAGGSLTSAHLLRCWATANKARSASAAAPTTARGTLRAIARVWWPLCTAQLGLDAPAACLMMHEQSEHHSQAGHLQLQHTASERASFCV